MELSLKASLLIICAGFLPPISAQELSPTEIIRKADDKFRGEMSGYSEMVMTIIRPSWQRSIEFRSWSKEDDYALTLITAPAREKGQTFLKRGNEMWSWNPAISRLIKLPPSMMSQGWMGSDYTNDDILRESSVVDDYLHAMEGEEEIAGRKCWKVRLTAREDADVLWGSQLWWVDMNDFIVVKAELYDEDNYLVRTEKGSEIKTVDGRLLPTVIELIPAENEGYKTVINIVDMKFNIDINDSFFSQQNMKTIR
ncbi:MAG TPA: outer membrane lipoprotein-sorting protein [Bacteroidales bacterium]|nr:outer membrane lipoprotein-sorting protein [Bacteroidales bacterium]HPF01606.1 outer membrane lipoprotein-sorting protein [Bacteroidales bacterium]HPJ59337.1 outer membrane lipoprotein-sorting protein [Bacteroidales bacterium]HPR13217.1 outer membrane lipoprotein-sorting protein [Bacteroidales bacterium]HRW85649.1 outer membrane lipoprotein-sorting protein [Bacteroidales bacterium]